MRDGDNIREVASLGVDYIGMIFYPKSPRFVNMISTHAGIIPDRGNPDAPSGGTLGAKLVGVFVDEMPQNIITRVVNFGLDVIQLHGSESPTLIRNLRHTIDPDLRPGVQIWKAVALPASSDRDACRQAFADARQYESCADALLFDTSTPAKGGSGQHFDWSVLDDYDGRLPFMLSGGIGPDDAALLRAWRHPKCMGIDLNSRFETAPGMKDVQKIKSFLEQL